MKRIIPNLLFAALCLGFAPVAAWAAMAGEITHLSGILSVKQPDGTSKILSVKSKVNEGDLLSTEAETYARIKFVDGEEVVLRPNTQLKVDSYRFDQDKPANDNILLSMLKGGLRAVSGLIGKRNKEKVAYQTPTATIGIRGTHFGALFCQGGACMGIPTPSGHPPPEGLHVDVAAGAISVTTKAGTAVFNAGQFGYVPSPNVLPQVVPPEQGIKVTMPASIASNKGEGSGIGRDSASECTP